MTFHLAFLWFQDWTVEPATTTSRFLIQKAPSGRYHPTGAFLIRFQLPALLHPSQVYWLHLRSRALEKPAGRCLRYTRH